MQKMKSVLFVCLLAFFFLACKKDAATPGAAEKILGTWTLQSDIYHQYVGGIDYSDTTLGMGTTFKFTSDGTASIETPGQGTSSAVYYLTGDTQITIGGTNTYDIKTLTSNALILYSKHTQGTDYYEETISLSR
jgi:hypothetical protein